jgi:putative FmdB family regulatory protein
VPIYDYGCTNCGHVTEVIHGINDSGPRFCPDCGAEGTMKKALSAPAVVFKGSGWAKVDRRSSSGSSSGTKASKAKSEGTTGASSTTTEGGSKSTEAKSSEAKSSGGDSGSGAASSSTKGDD